MQACRHKNPIRYNIVLTSSNIPKLARNADHIVMNSEKFI